ncbi:MAG TPA: alpha/beta fold hydrolase [Thermoanaerobaculia bacterium]|nr:alpha/beta fold hydrolase [Thermoanaerobaculia bacterium]
MTGKLRARARSTAILAGVLASALAAGPRFAAGWNAANRAAGTFVTVESGAKLWVESEGKGPPLLLIPGGPGMAQDYFHPYFSRLAVRNRVIYFDAAGRGRSSNAVTYSLSRDVADIEGLRKALGLTALSLFGHSYGGTVALAYALRFPQAVDKLILADAPLSGAAWQRSIDACNRRIRDELPAVWSHIQRLRAAGARSSSPAHQAVYEVPAGFYFYRREVEGAAALAVNPRVYYAIAGDDADFKLGGELAKLDLRPGLAALRMPVLLLAGRHDQVVPVEDALAARVGARRVKVAVLEHSGHFPFIEEPEETMALIERFLAPAR